MPTVLCKGIILRIYVPQRKKLAILDAHFGKIECITHYTPVAQRLTHGMYISYILEPWRDSFKISEISILDMPLYWARSSSNNFVFFHHVLELCYYFLSINNAAHEIYILIKLLYTNPELIQTDISKRIFLCRFFIRLGIYPENALSYNSQFFSLISGPLDSKVNAEHERALYRELQRWLLSCVSVHPYAHNIKTIDFLRKLGIHEQ
jgi:hypothetical protein